MSSRFVLDVMAGVLLVLAGVRADGHSDNPKSPVRSVRAQDVFEPKKQIMFQDDFRSESAPLGRWNYSENDQYHIEQATPKRIQVVNAPGLPKGHQAVRFVVERTPNSFRSEISLPHEKGFQDRWYAARVLIPEEWVFDPSKARTIAMQWHAIPGDGRATFPNLDIAVRNDRWCIHQSFGDPKTKPSRVMTELKEPVKRGEWVSWVIHAKWSPRDDGRLEIWKDGQVVVDQKGPNVYGTIGVEYTPYLKTGIYHPAWNLKTDEARAAFEKEKPVAKEKIVYVTDVRIGNETSKYRDFASETLKK